MLKINLSNHSIFKVIIVEKKGIWTVESNAELKLQRKTGSSSNPSDKPDPDLTLYTTRVQILPFKNKTGPDTKTNEKMDPDPKLLAWPDVRAH